jgi:hypothetical protein
MHFPALNAVPARASTREVALGPAPRLTSLPAPRAPCRDLCVDPALWEHHDRLLRVDTDSEALLELIELAVTWGELDYSSQPIVGPRQWSTFAGRHHWTIPEHADRAFDLAIDIVNRHAPKTPTPTVSRRRPGRASRPAIALTASQANSLPAQSQIRTLPLPTAEEEDTPLS